MELLVNNEIEGSALNDIDVEILEDIGFPKLRAR